MLCVFSLQDMGHEKDGLSVSKAEFGQRNVEKRVMKDWQEVRQVLIKCLSFISQTLLLRMESCFTSSMYPVSSEPKSYSRI